MMTMIFSNGYFWHFEQIYFRFEKELKAEIFRRRSKLIWLRNDEDCKIKMFFSYETIDINN